MLIDLALIQTAEAKALARMEAARGAALADLTGWLAATTAAVTGPVPLAEQLSWLAKEAEARALLAGGPEGGMIAGEAAVTGEPAADLAARIVARADAYRVLIAALTGLRRKMEGAIGAAGSEAELVNLALAWRAAGAALLER